jgi:hypothetical protein
MDPIPAAPFLSGVDPNHSKHRTIKIAKHARVQFALGLLDDYNTCHRGVECTGIRKLTCLRERVPP